MILKFCIITSFPTILQTNPFSPKINLQLVSYEVLLDFSANQGSWATPQLFQNISSKKTKNYSTWPTLCKFQAIAIYTSFLKKNQMDLYFNDKSKHTLLGIKSPIG